MKKKYDLYYVHVMTEDGKTVEEKEFLTKKDRDTFVKSVKKSYKVISSTR